MIGEGSFGANGIKNESNVPSQDGVSANCHNLCFNIFGFYASRSYSIAFTKSKFGASVFS